MGDTIHLVLCIVPATIPRQVSDCGVLICLQETTPIFTENPALTNCVVTMQPADMTDMHDLVLEGYV